MSISQIMGCTSSASFLYALPLPPYVHIVFSFSKFSFQHFCSHVNHEYFPNPRPNCCIKSLFLSLKLVCTISNKLQYPMPWNCILVAVFVIWNCTSMMHRTVSWISNVISSCLIRVTIWQISGMCTWQKMEGYHWLDYLWPNASTLRMPSLIHSTMSVEMNG